MFAGIDYITLWSRSSPEANTTFYNNCSDWVAGLSVDARGVKPATLYGTKGIRNEGAYIGIGSNSALLNVPGPLAQIAYERFYNPSHRCTRLDIQVTCSNGYDVKSPMEPFVHYLAQLDKYVPTGRGKKAVPSYTGKGETLTVYSGARAGKAMGRLYNKWLQSKDPTYKHMIRWEAQFRREYAAMLADKWLMATGDDITSDIPGLLASFWEKRGITVPFKFVHNQLWKPPPSAKYDYEKTLKWLTTTVAPSIERLTGYVSRTKIMIALGLEIEGIDAYNAALSGASLSEAEDVG